MEDTHFLKNNADLENQYIVNNNNNGKLHESEKDLQPSLLRKNYEDRRQDKIRIFFQSIALIGSTFAIHVLTVGLSFSIGVYYVVFLHVFNQGNGLTAWIGSINFATLCASGPISSYLIERIGCFRTIVIGGLISSIGLLASVFAVNIYMLFATFGFMTGIGFGLCFTANLSVITYNFDKWRVASMGISLSGVGFGTFLHPFLANYLIDSYGWRGSLLITSSINMHVCLAGMIIWIAQDKSSQNKTETAHNETDKDSKNNCDNQTKSMWFNFMYLTLHANAFLFCFGQSVVYTHIAAFASKIGFTTAECSSFISIVGIANLFGRIILGFTTQHPCVNVTVLYVICYLTAGLWTVFFIIWHMYLIMAIIICALGIAMAAFGPLLSEIVCQAVGVQNFARAYGFLMLSMAAGTLLGAPSAGWIYDITCIYENSFYIGGASFVLSGLIIVIPAIWERYTRKKNDAFVSKMQQNGNLSKVIEKHLSNSTRFLPHYGSQPLIIDTIVSSI